MKKYHKTCPQLCGRVLNDCFIEIASHKIKPKFFTLKEEQLQSIHIDGDVFIKSQQCLDLIKDSNCDLFVQGEESISLSNNMGIAELYIENHKSLSHLNLLRD